MLCDPRRTLASSLLLPWLPPCRCAGQDLVDLATFPGYEPDLNPVLAELKRNYCGYRALRGAVVGKLKPEVKVSRTGAGGAVAQGDSCPVPQYALPTMPVLPGWPQDVAPSVFTLLDRCEPVPNSPSIDWLRDEALFMREASGGGGCLPAGLPACPPACLQDTRPVLACLSARRQPAQLWLRGFWWPGRPSSARQLLDTCMPTPAGQGGAEARAGR